MEGRGEIASVAEEDCGGYGSPETQGSHGRHTKQDGNTPSVHSGTHGHVNRGALRNAPSSPGLLLPTRPPGIFEERDFREIESSEDKLGDEVEV